jgi:heme/copper-type cytochrome/quinol oxidase subunit 2
MILIVIVLIVIAVAVFRRSKSRSKSRSAQGRRKRGGTENAIPDVVCWIVMAVGIVSGVVLAVTQPIGSGPSVGLGVALVVVAYAGPKFYIASGGSGGGRYRGL